MNACEHCHGPIDSTGFGRPAKFCSNACRQAAHRARRAVHNGAATQTDAPPPRPAPHRAGPSGGASTAGTGDQILEDLLRDLQDGARDLIRILHTSDGEEPLQRIHRLQEQLDGLTYGFVGLARHRRVTWVRISKILDINEDTARRRYTNHNIWRRLTRFAPLRAIPTTSLTTLYSAGKPPASATAAVPDKGDAHSDTGPAPTPRDPSGAGYNRLAPVLSMLVRTSQQTNKQVSGKIGISPSYLSRILSGERVPTWALTLRFARACGADPDVLHTVWASEKERADEQPSGDEEPALPAATRLHQAVLTLHAKAGRPTSQDIARASRWTLSVSEVATVTEGSQIPGWRTLKSVVDLLGGDAAYFRKLWKHAEREHSQGPEPSQQTPVTPEVPARVDDVLTTFSTTFNEEIVESQMARLLEKRAKQPQNRRHRLAELAARHTAPGRTWPLRVARPGL